MVTLLPCHPILTYCMWISMSWANINTLPVDVCHIINYYLLAASCCYYDIWHMPFIGCVSAPTKPFPFHPKHCVGRRTILTCTARLSSTVSESESAIFRPPGAMIADCSYCSWAAWGLGRLGVEGKDSKDQHRASGHGGQAATCQSGEFEYTLDTEGSLIICNLV